MASATVRSADGETSATTRVVGYKQEVTVRPEFRTVSTTLGAPRQMEVPVDGAVLEADGTMMEADAGVVLLSPEQQKERSNGIALMVLMLFAILIALVVIILLWVQDLQTNQYADTALLAVAIILMIVVVCIGYSRMP